VALPQQRHVPATFGRAAKSPADPPQTSLFSFWFIFWRLRLARISLSLLENSSQSLLASRSLVGRLWVVIFISSFYLLSIAIEHRVIIRPPPLTANHPHHPPLHSLELSIRLIETQTTCPVAILVYFLPGRRPRMRNTEWMTNGSLLGDS
jgi:hypothetical protein